MRFAFADPPYPGQARRHYAKHPDYAGEVDHAELIERLGDYDAWALCTGSKMLQEVLALCPPVRVLIWRKPGVPFGDGFLWCYEPVLIRTWRKPTGRVADVIEMPPPGALMTFRARPDGHVIGRKPERFCQWLFEACGLVSDDEFYDLYPGSGAVLRAWEAWRSQLQLGAVA